MRALLSIVKVRFQLLLQYRAAAMAGLVTQIFFGGIFVMIFDAFYRSSTGVTMPMTYQETVTYIWLGQAFLGLLPWNGDREVQKMIRTGGVAYELLRPLDLYGYWYARIFAQRIAGTLLRCVPLLIVASLLPAPYGLLTPKSPMHLFYMVISMLIAVLLGCAMSNLITIAVLFTIGDGIDRLFPAVVMFFSGMVIPIPLFPDWSQIIFRVLPFSGLTDTAYRYYLGMYGSGDFLISCLHGVFWTIILIGFGQWLVLRAGKRIVVQGG